MKKLMLNYFSQRHGKVNPLHVLGYNQPMNPQDNFFDNELLVSRINLCRIIIIYHSESRSIHLSYVGNILKLYNITHAYPLLVSDTETSLCGIYSDCIIISPAELAALSEKHPRVNVCPDCLVKNTRN